MNGVGSIDVCESKVFRGVDIAEAVARVIFQCDGKLWIVLGHVSRGVFDVRTNTYKIEKSMMAGVRDCSDR